MGVGSGSAFYSIPGKYAGGADLMKKASRASTPVLNVVAPQDSKSGGAVDRVPGARYPVSLLSDLTSTILLWNTHHSLNLCWD